MLSAGEVIGQPLSGPSIPKSVAAVINAHASWLLVWDASDVDQRSTSQTRSAAGASGGLLLNEQRHDASNIAPRETVVKVIVLFGWIYCERGTNRTRSIASAVHSTVARRLQSTRSTRTLSTSDPSSMTSAFSDELAADTLVVVPDSRAIHEHEVGRHNCPVRAGRRRGQGPQPRSGRSGATRP